MVHAIFIDNFQSMNNKAVFSVKYNWKKKIFYIRADEVGFSLISKNVNIDEDRIGCEGILQAVGWSEFSGRNFLSK